MRRGRGKAVVDEVLGESFEGVLVSDFYAAYNHYPGLKQRCWAHLLRDIHELKALYPQDSVLARWAGAVRRLYARAKVWADAGALPATRSKLVLERQLLSLCRPFSDDPLAPQAKLCRRIDPRVQTASTEYTSSGAEGQSRPAPQGAPDPRLKGTYGGHSHTPGEGLRSSALPKRRLATRLLRVWGGESRPDPSPPLVLAERHGE